MLHARPLIERVYAARISPHRVAVCLAVVAASVLTGQVAHAQAIFPANPDWVSTDTGYATGGALADLNRDGWLDFVVANGNDMARQRLVVYYNNGAGGFPTAPSWQSSNIGYNGHISVADVNGDGWPDVAVAILLNQGGTCVKLYMNIAGTLESNPSWSSAFIAPAFTCAFGDVNNDGRPDLAVGTGDGYSGNPHAYKNVVHMNVNGALETTPSWQSADTWCYDSVLWADVNNDGWLDLIGLGTKTYTWVYLNNNGALSTTATWRTNDVPSQFGLMGAVGDIDKDGYPDLVLADNNQLTGGSGRFRRYNGLPAGLFSQSANWTYSDGYCSAVALADVDADGDLDLLTGAWWGYTRIFFGNAGIFGATSDWNSAGTVVVERILLGDIDRRSVIAASKMFPAGPRRLYYLGRQPIQDLVRVRRDGVDLTPAQYTCNAEQGWLTINAAPASVLQVDFTFSTSLDMAVTTWDNTIGNYVYFSRLTATGDTNCDGTLNLFDIQAFVTALGDPAGYASQYPNCRLSSADMNADGTVNLFDIQLFVDAL